MAYINEQDLRLIYYVNVSMVKQIISLHFVNCFSHVAQLSCHPIGQMLSENDGLQ